ncbi:putative lipid II flippase FtsW [Methylovulum psychrotolerans]|uniref:Probable peptidoglycan glycosyltransferase FtsW n=1 Tax=Methylovulum psychrotolerans TaxID=1704499 RepID=A0A1Z4C030_9GAMM|nr:putative lipid II flippase FtsW [Methylovulum psychrotolerans]ASF46873.1 putative lipid II flippase FtsW [Methylovulum psychrotolerans]POZ50324.1 putative lipid II flippase FtsW [Methylovulum psychrotolerans]
MSKKGKKPAAEPFHYDANLVAVCACLLLIGYVMVTSSSLHLDTKASLSASTFTVWGYPLKQLIHISLGLIMARYIVMIPMRNWQKMAQWLFIAGLVLLVVVLLPGIGVNVNGSTRWLQLAGIRIQVSELVKFAAVVYMARYVNRHQQELRESAFGLLKPLLVFSVASLLLLLEPDFGSAVVILMIAMGMMFLAGARVLQFGLLFGGLIISGALLVYFEPYRMKRVTSFLNPWEDPRNTGFQLIQALVSFERGELTGVGLGGGLQKLYYLPEAHTDFLFSVIAEELGLLGVVAVIGLFALLVCRAFSIAVAAEKAGEQFSAFIAYGLGIWFGFQAFVNMGVNMGILPTKGLTLPLMSYGGGSMMIMCCAVALLFRVHSEVTEINANTLPEPRVKAKAKA